jgi:hypothetical protein
MNLQSELLVSLNKMYLNQIVYRRFCQFFISLYIIIMFLSSYICHSLYMYMDPFKMWHSSNISKLQ